MMEISSSETSGHTIATLRHIPEDGIPYSHRREKLKPYEQRKCWDWGQEYSLLAVRQCCIT
jgi:hypothetical protein